MEHATDAPGGCTGSSGRVNDYDGFAEAYSAENEDNLVNAYYERPAMPALAGDVAGRRILDAGCGSGPLTAALRDRGAVVTGIDASAGMLALARRRLGDDAALHVADRLPRPLDQDHVPVLRRRGPAVGRRLRRLRRLGSVRRYGARTTPATAGVGPLPRRPGRRGGGNDGRVGLYAGFCLPGASRRPRRRPSI